MLSNPFLERWMHKKEMLFNRASVDGAMYLVVRKALMVVVAVAPGVGVGVPKEAMAH